VSPYLGNPALSALWRKYGNVFGVVTPASARPRSGAKAGVQEFWIPAPAPDPAPRFAGMTEPLAPLNNLSRECVPAFRTLCTKMGRRLVTSGPGRSGVRATQGKAATDRDQEPALRHFNARGHCRVSQPTAPQAGTALVVPAQLLQLARHIGLMTCQKHHGPKPCGLIFLSGS